MRIDGLFRAFVSSCEKKQIMQNDLMLTGQRATLNPYMAALYLLRGRLLWDLKRESWRSRRILKQWKDRFPGGKAVILCNGPSLLETDFSLLENVFTFGLNKINLLFDRSDFRPSCVMATDPMILEQNAAFYNSTELPLFLDSRGMKWIKPRGNVVFLHSSPQLKIPRDSSMSVMEAKTVTVVAMELAFHFGFRDVAIVGCDHNFATKGLGGKTVTSEGADKSHFDPRYFTSGQKWQLPDTLGIEHEYGMCGDLFATFGGRIVNCTDGGKLEVFPRMRLEEWARGE
jgi:hypothetical protein